MQLRSLEVFSSSPSPSPLSGWEPGWPLSRRSSLGSGALAPSTPTNNRHPPSALAEPWLRCDLCESSDGYTLKADVCGLEKVRARDPSSSARRRIAATNAHSFSTRAPQSGVSINFDDANVLRITLCVRPFPAAASDRSSPASATYTRAYTHA
jgi:hypothetical protein